MILIVRLDLTNSLELRSKCTNIYPRQEILRLDYYWIYLRLTTYLFRVQNKFIFPYLCVVFGRNYCPNSASEVGGLKSGFIYCLCTLWEKANEIHVCSRWFSNKTLRYIWWDKQCRSTVLKIMLNDVHIKDIWLLLQAIWNGFAIT